MKNKKGFTLVELLAVLVIMAALITIAVPNVITLAKKVKVNMFCEKVDLLVTNAKLYGQDNIDAIEEGKLNSVSVAALVNYGYAKKDNNKCESGNSSNPCIKDPRDDSMMDSETLNLSISNKRVNATFNFKTADASICTK
jgi:prepilin-type N-terminal cleavage/methylation domain-containing protein